MGPTEFTTGTMAITPEPVFLVRLEPWRLVFFRNFTDLFIRSRHVATESSPPGVFWPDVFVPEHLPWNKLLQSLICHIAFVLALFGITRVLPRYVPLAEDPVLNRADVIYYTPSEYLPPLNTGAPETRRYPQEADSEYARQAVISVPLQPDNKSQTIVTPPDVKLERDLALPNIVAWSQVQPAVPLQATANAPDRRSPALPVPVVSPVPEVTDAFSRQMSALPRPVVAPPPEANTAVSSRNFQAPQPSVIQPAPDVAAASTRLGDVNIGHSDVVSPAPVLPLAEQRTLRGLTPGTSAAGAAVVPPAPSLSGAASSGSGRLIALGIHPAALAQSVEVPGNRRATFSATPTGRRGGSESPNPLSGKSSAGLPAGLLVEQGPARAASQASGLPSSGSSPSEPIQSAKVTLPVVTDAKSRPAAKVSDEKVTDLDRQVFGARKFYSMILNMPNLNSAGGSWVIRFAELTENESKGDISAPVATQKVDPPYPTELMRHNVQGTVTLRAVIRSDGSVGDVRVLRGVDYRLDEYARVALLQWRFLPALKNGNAVDLEAVVIIPFRPLRMQSGF
jgi:TonB family protein